MAVMAFFGLVNMQSKRGVAQAAAITANAGMTALVVENYAQDRTRLTKLETDYADTLALLRQAQAERDAARQSIAEMVIEVTKAKAEIMALNGLEAKVKELQAQVDDLKAQVFKMSEERQQLITERDQAKREVDELRRQLEEERRLREQLQAEVEKLKQGSSKT